MPEWPRSSLSEDDRTSTDYSPELQQALDDYLATHRLGNAFADNLKTLYQPMADWLAKRHQSLGGRAMFVGINGAQGSGKSTLTGLLEILLNHLQGKRLATLSIDDLYLTLRERQQLAKDVHPLFITRGVPGTHDVALGMRLFDAWSDAGASSMVAVPRFDKSIDDRLPQTEWKQVNGPIDIVLFEGWCVGAHQQEHDALTEPANELEALEDGNAVWRGYVNTRLASDYRELFDRLDLLMMLKVPSMEQVYEWRGLQESKLKHSSAETAQGVMDSKVLKRFIMHYERLTRHQLEEMPARADVFMPLNPDHQIADVVIHR